MGGPVIVLEFNELTPNLMDAFIADGSLPAFQKLRKESIVCVSDAEEEAPQLEPWIQWVTVHTGLSYSEHQVFDLGEGAKLNAPRIWDAVADAGERAWICGSMNAAVQSKRSENLYVLPDPWSTDVQPLPDATFRPYFNFVRTYVQEYTRDKVPLRKGDYLRFARFMISHGLSLKTVFDTMRQLASERGSNSRWRRAAILDRLQWDVFRHFYRKLRPRLATFFLNSTAHYQHYYWRNMKPDLFEVHDTSNKRADTADAIRFGYQKMDEIVRECLELASPDTTIVLCTALGQQPMTKYDKTGGKQIFKIHDADTLLKFAGINSKFQYAPVMAEEFHLYFESEQDAAVAERKLKALRLADRRPAMSVRRDVAGLFCGCAIVTETPGDIPIVGGNFGETMPFDALFYPVEGIKSGMHHPDGILWIRRPDRTHRVVQRKVSLRELAPTLLALCQVRRPAAFPRGPMPEVLANV